MPLLFASPPVDADAIRGQILRISFKGRLDAPRVLAAYGRLPARRQLSACDHLVVDLSGLSWIDSSGMGLLVRLQRRAARAGCGVTVVCGSPQPRKLLEATGLDRTIRVVDQLDELRPVLTLAA